MTLQLGIECISFLVIRNARDEPVSSIVRLRIAQKHCLKARGSQSTGREAPYPPPRGLDRLGEEIAVPQPFERIQYRRAIVLQWQPLNHAVLLNHTGTSYEPSRLLGHSTK